MPYTAYTLKLKALGYIKIDDFNVLSDDDFRSLVVWLEDQIIRHYPIEARTPLRKIKSSDWDKAFEVYLQKLACPYTHREEVADWLLGLAVKLEYNDNVELYKNVQIEEEVKSSSPQVVSSNPLDNMDFESEDFKGYVKTLANQLKIAQHPDHLLTLSACCKVIKTYCSKEALANKENKKKGSFSTVLDMPLGFSTNDPILDKAAKILRLCFINDLRKLQTQVNETIVQIQNITANPKTDTRLGKVGR